MAGLGLGARIRGCSLYQMVSMNVCEKDADVREIDTLELGKDTGSKANFSILVFCSRDLCGCIVMDKARNSWCTSGDMSSLGLCSVVVSTCSSP